MRNKLFIFFVIALLISCNLSRQLHQSPNDLMIQAATLTFKEYYSKLEIPKRLGKSYRKIYEQNQPMANKNEKFNPLDVPQEGVPSRRFVFGANALSGDCQLFVYEEGGVGLKNFCIISETQKDHHSSIAKVYLFKEANDINDLKVMIQKKEYRLSDENYAMPKLASIKLFEVYGVEDKQGQLGLESAFIDVSV